ncbi:MAG: PTS sugar transporter subunit IIA [Deltaproteobacteria bacterium]|nr:PTS sugar transporter subunit IIA [Deltaproteobacteria bacterium]
MIGLVIVTHGQLGAELYNTAKLIVGERETTAGEGERCQSVAIEMNLDPDYLRALIAKAVKNQDRGQGVLILTDMFGGTPSNISLSFLEEDQVEVVTGVSLPMLLRVFQLREKPAMTLAELANDTMEYSRKAIIIAGKLLGQRPK